MSNTVTVKVSKDFHDWWQKQACSNDQGLMFLAWSAWKACEDCIKQKESEK